MDDLDAQARQLLRLLVNHVASADFSPGQPKTYLTYKAAHDQLPLPCRGAPQHDVGMCLQNHGLDALADWTKNTSKPGITGIIVNGTTRMPGKGYFQLFGKEEADARWWLAEAARAKTFDWSPYVGITGAGADFSSVAEVQPIVEEVAETLPSPPTKKYPVRELVEQAGIDVAAWGFTKDGDVIENPNDNIGRNTKWSFVGVPPEPIVLCVWYKRISWDATPPVYRTSEYPYQKRLIEIAGTRKGSDGLSRLNGKIARSRAVHNAVCEAYRDARPVRMILVDGDEIPIEEAADEASKVVARELDPVTWYVHSFDGVTGNYAIVRGGKPSAQSVEESALQNDLLNDPAFGAFLASLDETERDAIVKVRVCQGAFREALLERWGGCAVTECNFKETLIASHIRPWSRCETAEQRQTPANGLLLSPNLDKLFDTGLISFDDRYRIVFSARLSDKWANSLGVSRSMRLKSSVLPDILPYLQWHRENRLQK